RRRELAVQAQEVARQPRKRGREEERIALGGPVQARGPGQHLVAPSPGGGGAGQGALGRDQEGGVAAARGQGFEEAGFGAARLGGGGMDEQGNGRGRPAHATSRTRSDPEATPFFQTWLMRMSHSRSSSAISS